MIRQFFKWIFKSELQQLESQLNTLTTQVGKTQLIRERCELQERKLKKILENIDISVDVNHSKYSP